MSREEDRQVDAFTRRESELERKRRIRRKPVDRDVAAAIRAAITAVEPAAAAPHRHVGRVRLLHVAFVLTACEGVAVDAVRLAVQGFLFDIGAGPRAVRSVTVAALPAPDLDPTPSGPRRAS